MNNNPTPIQIISLTTEALGEVLDKTSQAHRLSRNTINTSHNLAEAITTAIREHHDAEQANTAMNRTTTAEAHRTMAQRLAAAGAFLASGKLEIL